MKKILLVPVALALVVILCACTNHTAGVAEWAKTVTAEDIYAAKAWRMYPTDRFDELEADEIKELVELINSLDSEDFEYNKQNAGTTPEYGVEIQASTGMVGICQGRELDISYAGKQFWIDSPELNDFLIEKSGWEPTPVWDGTITPTDIP